MARGLDALPGEERDGHALCNGKGNQEKQRELSGEARRRELQRESRGAVRRSGREEMHAPPLMPRMFHGGIELAAEHAVAARRRFGR